MLTATIRTIYDTIISYQLLHWPLIISMNFCFLFQRIKNTIIVSDRISTSTDTVK